MGEMQLQAGWNNIAYPGKTLPIEQAVASIMDSLIDVWYGDLYYAPGDPGGSLLYQMVSGEAYWIQVTQDVTWTYPLPDEPPPPESGAPMLLLLMGVVVIGIIASRERR